MKYKDTLLFIAKCLTITLEKNSKKEIAHQLKTTEIDWDLVVKVSTAQYVFPALYCNLKRANFLDYLPEDLVNYMIHITNLNRDRNQQIIEQAKKINQLLLANNITPIFFKGTSFLLENLYEDIAERMVGDIDFLVDKKLLEKTNSILLENNYIASDIVLPNNHRHLPRLINKDSIAALEVHSDILTIKHAPFFNYDIVNKDVLSKDSISHFSYQNQLNTICLSRQLNDDEVNTKNVSLKTSYDVFLLSKEVNSLHAAKQIKPLCKYINSYLAVTSLLLNYPKTIIYVKNSFTKKQINSLLLLLNNKKYSKIRSRYLFYKTRTSVVFKSIYNKHARSILLDKVFKKK